ncbi:MAG: right-handed parallel beta-helix repeat-containing protein, partial [Sphingobacteriales bacterium]
SMKPTITKLMLIAAGILFGTLAQAQSYNISFSQNAGMPPGGFVTTDLNTSGTVILGSSTMSANQWSAVQTLPFPFYFYGSLVTQYKVSANGVLTFDVNTAILPGSNTAIPSASLPDSTIAFMWDDFTASAPTASGDVCRVNTYGTAPNRQHWVWYYSYEVGSPAYSYAYWAVVLEESTNKIYIVDQYNAAGTSGTTVGVQLNQTTGVMDPLSPNIIHEPNGTAVTDNDLWTITPSSPCVDPPTPGSATATNTSPCVGQSITLGLTGNSTGSGQSYQWETATSASGPWTATGSSLSSPGLVVTPASGVTYYRAQVTCGTTTLPSQEIAVAVSPAFPGGTYTINASAPASSTNFQSFSSALAAIDCGIAGPVTFNLTGSIHSYNEQITFPSTIGTTTVNTITINGNGDTLTSAGLTNNFATINFDGADHITINNLVVVTTGGASGFALHLMNSSDSNSFNGCTFVASTTATGTTSGCVSMSGSAIDYSTTGTNGTYNTFTNCTTEGGYFGFAFYGLSSAMAGNANNSIINCTVRNYYVYGSYNYYQSNATISGTEFTRPTRSTVSSGYGVYLTTGCTNMLVEKNRIHNLFDAAAASVTSTSYAIYCSSDGTTGNENKIINNLIYNLGGSGTHAGLYLTGANYINVYHNTIALNTQNSTAGTTYGIYATGTAGIDIRNNNIAITRSGTGTKYCLYFTNTGKISDNNNLYVDAPAGTNYVGYYTTPYATLAGVSGWRRCRRLYSWHLSA